MGDNEVSRVANGYLLENKVTEALKYTRAYAAAHPYESDAHYWLGVSLLFAKKYLEAREAFENGAKQHPGDPDALFGLAAVHYTLGNYQTAGEYMAGFLASRNGGTPGEDELTGRACMLSGAGAYAAALLFLEHLNTRKAARSPRLDEVMENIYGDYLDYALKQKPRLGDRWLLLKDIAPENKEAVNRLVRHLIGELSWGDAIFLYRKHLGPGCAKCPKAAKEKNCLACIANRLLPPNYMFCPGLFTRE